MNEIRVFDGAGKLKRVITSQQASKIYWDSLILKKVGITQKVKRKRKFNPHWRRTNAKEGGLHGHNPAMDEGAEAQ